MTARIARTCLATSVMSVVLLLLSVPGARAQAAVSSVSGETVDESGAVVAGATVTVSHLGQGWSRTSSSDSAGRFTIAALPSGSYRFVAGREGLQPYEIARWDLPAGETRHVRAVLRVSKVSETVDVAAARNDRGAIGLTMPPALIDALPLNGRTLQPLLLLAPGVNLTPGQSLGASGQFSVNGQRPNANTFVVDGASANVGVGTGQVPGEGGSGTLPALTAQGGTSSLVSIDALREFTLLTSTFAAEYGPGPGGQIVLVTRSGTNAFHGSAFEYFRDDALDAADYFVVRNHLTKPPARQHQLGGTVGGPLRARRSFFFFSHETLRLDQPTAMSGTTVSLAARAAAPPATQPILNAYPLPTGADLTNGTASYAASFSIPSRSNATSVRIDHVLGPNLALFARFHHAPSSIAQRSATLPSVIQDLAVDTDTFTSEATWVLGERSVATFGYNASHVTAQGAQHIDGFGGAIAPPASAMLPAIAEGAGFFNVNITGLPGFGIGTDARNSQQQHQLTMTLTRTHGAHTLKSGAGVRHLRSTLGTDRESQYRATYSFPGVAAASSGALSLALINLRETSRLDFNAFSLFVQDDWRPSAALTVNAGVRYDLQPPPHGASDADQPWTITALDVPAAVTVAPAGTPLFHTRRANLAPRIGASWKAGRSPLGDLTLRGGYGLYFDSGVGVVASAAGAFPLLRTRRVSAATFPLSDANAAPVARDAPAPYDLIRAFDPAIATPHTHQFSATVDQQLGPTFVLSASYVGARGHQLLRQESINAPNPSISLLQVTTNGDTSSYDGLQLQLAGRARGATTRINYTRAVSMDTASADNGFLAPTVQFPPANDRGPSDWDVGHAFSAAVSWVTPLVARLPRWLQGAARDWTLDAIVHARSGAPINVTGSRIVGSSFFTLRPDTVDGVPIWIDDDSVPGGRRINAPAFRFDSTIRHGTLGRNAVRGFAFWQVDASIGRRVRVRRDTQVELRAEAFNVFNHANLANPSGSLGTVSANGTIAPPASFGVSSTMLRSAYSGLSPLYQVGGPRSVQLALRIRF